MDELLLTLESHYSWLTQPLSVCIKLLDRLLINSSLLLSLLKKALTLPAALANGLAGFGQHPMERLLIGSQC
jgi:hypothetical protein